MSYFSVINFFYFVLPFVLSNILDSDSSPMCMTFQLPSVSNVQIEPIIVQIDRLDLVLEENSEFCASSSSKR